MKHSTICGIPVPAILNHKNSTGLAGGAKNSQNGGIFVPNCLDSLVYLEISTEKLAFPDGVPLSGNWSGAISSSTQLPSSPSLVSTGLFLFNLQFSYP